MTTIIISVSIWIASILGWILFNLYNKNKKLENMVINQSDFISNMKVNIRQFDELANKIDAQIWVQSDPEFLALFEKVKEIQSSLQTYVD
jgi:hypothetical protein